MSTGAAYQPAEFNKRMLIPPRSSCDPVGDQIMRYLNQFIWAALILAVAAAPAFAQGGGAPGGSSGGGLSGGGGMSGGGGLSGGGGAGGSSTTQLASLASTPTITAPTSSGGNTGNSLSTSNFLANYYANPYYQGILSNAQSNNNSPGGFGTVLFSGSGSSGGGGQIGYAGTSGGATAGRGTTGGGGKGTSGNQQPGVVVPPPVAISFRTRLDPSFDAPPIVLTELQMTIARDIAHSRDVSNPGSIQVSTEAGGIVVLRGNVKDAREAKIIEGMVRVTPGVHGVKNELK
jgi:hypothetical protein